MKFVVFLNGYADPDRDWDALPESEQRAEMAQHEVFAENVAQRDGCEIVAAEPLTGGERAAVLRLSATGAPALTEGPYAESTESIAGVYIVEAPDRDTLVDLLAALTVYVMEIRPVGTVQPG